jgi:polyisoprenoid-binding protein YceI
MRLVSRILLATVLLAPALARAADNYKVDSVHATVIYRLSHLNVGNAYGRFNEPTGTVVLDKENPSNSSFTFEIDVNKIDTANEKRDQHLKSPDFFDAKQFPTITFKSTKVEASGDDFKVTGDLTLHGVTKSITVNLKKTGESQTQMGYRTGWEATHDLKRSEYGMTGMQGAIGDDVHLVISYEAVKQ